MKKGEVTVETKKGKVTQEEFENNVNHENNKINIVYASKSEVKKVVNEVLNEYKDSLEKLKYA